MTASAPVPVPAPTRRPRLTASALDILVDALHGPTPGHVDLAVADPDDASRLAHLDLLAPAPHPWADVARLTLEGYALACHHATARTRSRRIRGRVLDEAPYPYLPDYLAA